MADNVAITAGSGTTIATDDVSGTHFQRVKLVDGTLDSSAAIPGSATDGLLVNLGTNNDVVCTATDLDIRNLVLATDAVKVGDGTNLIDIDTAPADGEVNGGKRLLHTEAWLWAYNGTTWDRLRSDTTYGLDVDVTRVPTDPFGANADAASATGSISAKLRYLAATGIAGMTTLPTGSNAIGKLAANSGVDIGDVDVTSIAAGTNLIGDVGIKPRTSGGPTVHHKVSAATTNATNVKASAGQVFGWYIYNNTAAAKKVAFHNTAGSPTAGASIYFTVVIPGGSASNVEFALGIPFGTGIAYTMVLAGATIADADASAVAAGDVSMLLLYA
jgi:hypothetical protein